MCSSLNPTAYRDTPIPHTVCCLLSVIRCTPSVVICFSLIKAVSWLSSPQMLALLCRAVLVFTFSDLFQDPYFTPYLLRFLAEAGSRWLKNTGCPLYMLYIRALLFQRGMKFLFQEACPHQTSLKPIPFSLLSLFVTAFFFLPQGHFKDSTYCKVYWLRATQCCVWSPSNCFEVGNSLTC